MIRKKILNFYLYNKFIKTDKRMFLILNKQIFIKKFELS